MTTKNLRQGRIRVMSGDRPVRLEKTCAFTEGDLTFSRPKSTIQVKDRGTLSHLRRGDQMAASFTFAAKFVDKTLRETLEDGIYEGTIHAAVGLTPQAVNTVDLAYSYRQDSLVAASGEAISTKLANGVTPSSDSEYAELAGALRSGADYEEVTPGQFKVQPPAADTTMDVVYDAVGASTLDPRGVLPPAKESDARTMLLLLELDNVARSWIVDEVWELNHAYIENVDHAEGDEYDVLTFNGMAYISKVRTNNLTEGPGEFVHEVEIADTIFVHDSITIEIL